MMNYQQFVFQMKENGYSSQIHQGCESIKNWLWGNFCGYSAQNSANKLPITLR